MLSLAAAPMVTVSDPGPGMIDLVGPPMLRPALTFALASAKSIAAKACGGARIPLAHNTIVGANPT
jgi:hypothetical protein